MDWGKIKTILIVLFLATDIFLASSIFISQKKESETAPEIIDAAITLLKKNNISIDKSIIPSKIQSAPILQADNAVSDYKEFALLLLGDSILTEDGLTYISENGRLTYRGDYFEFGTAKKSNNGNYNQSETQKAAFARLKELGFDISSAKTVSTSVLDSIYTFKISDFYENLPIFSSNITVSLSGGDIVAMSGTWFNKKAGITQDNILKSTASVLTDFASSYDGLSPTEIKSTELGYIVFDEETYHKSASLIPANKITLSGGAEYFIDSRTSE